MEIIEKDDDQCLVNLKWSSQCKLHPDGPSGNGMNTFSDYLKCHIFSESFGVGEKRAQTLLLTIFLNKIKPDTPITKLSNVLFIGTNASKFLKV